MRLANRALIAALAMLVFCIVVSAQTPRPESDPRNQSPSVGTGGPVGGPTGLFTIYDGSTIRKGEYTFSIAYSNFDRDPGNVDITDIPSSFNIGLNDHIELFFRANLYRGIKVNNPSNLSSFYLPNVGLCGPGIRCSGPAIILAPSGPNVGTLAGSALFRPFNNQPFVGFPFIGGSAGDFQQGPGVIGGLFGFPGFNAQIGAPIGGNGNFGPASAFPGMGSPVGSILPGIVLATVQLPCTALTGNCRPPINPGPLNPITVPVSFTVSPSYLPDAPFVSRPYGQSSFTDFVVGAKIRLTGPNNPLGVAVIPFYRWYGDKANDAGGFNQLQRGASPGGSIGDFGLAGVIDARLSRHVNVSVNGTYIINSNPKSTAMADAVLLDRPNEFHAGIGLDFPINKHFQPIFEVRSTAYVGSRTPNALPNNPVELLGGAKIYPRRWFGFGVWYRRQLNEQDLGHFNINSAQNIQISQLSGVFVPGRGIIIVPGTTRPGTDANGVPLGFNFSDDPNGFGLQFFVGHRNARSVPKKPNDPPTVSLSSSSASITAPCGEGTKDDSCTPSPSWQVQLMADAKDPDNDTLLYSWTVTGGKITGEGRNVTWDLTGSMEGTYTASVDVNDGNGHTAHDTKTVTIAKCPHCVAPCPQVAASGPESGDDCTPITFTANVAGGPGNVTPTYNWSVSAGTITSGQGTSSITVDAKGVGGQSITATVDARGYDPACASTASATTAVKTCHVPSCNKTDEYGDMPFNREKARLDNFATELQNKPGSQGYIIGYGKCDGEGLARANRAKDYLVNSRNIDAGRITTVDGGCRAELMVQLFVCEQGAKAPDAMTDGAVSPCPACKVKKPHRRHKARHGRKKGSEDDDEE